MLVSVLRGQVSISGVVSAASWATPVAPGSIVAIFGTNLANATSVTANGVAAPVLFSSPGQINAWLPATPEWYTPVSESIVVTTPVGVSAPFSVPAFYGAPGLFTADSSGCGQAAALNISPAGAVSLNSPANSAQPGDYLAVFGTGFDPSVGVGLGGAMPPALTYRGPAPTLPGIDQINMLILPGVQEGCAVPLTLLDGLQSPTVSVSIHTGRGPCVDPPGGSYGQVTLLSTAGGSDAFSAIFRSGPNVQTPAPPVILPSPADFTTSGTVSSVSRSCALPGVTMLSFGPITIQAPGPKSAVAMPPDYRLTLPAGFINAGQYTISSSQGSATFTVGSPIQLQSTFPPGTVLSAQQGFTIRWTGGDSNDLVRVQMVSLSPVSTSTNTYWTTAGAGSITLSGYCTGDPLQRYCLWEGLPLFDAELIVDVLPPGNAIAATSGATQFIWDYRYVFPSLVLGY
jgi:uncharacterized protein (TIGR03437 family)